MLALIWSHYINIRAVNHALLFLLIRIYIALFSENNLIYKAQNGELDVSYRSFSTLHLYVLLTLTVALFKLINNDTKLNIVVILNQIIGFIGVVYRFYDFENFVLTLNLFGTFFLVNVSFFIFMLLV